MLPCDVLWSSEQNTVGLRPRGFPLPVEAGRASTEKTHVRRVPNKRWEFARQTRSREQMLHAGPGGNEQAPWRRRDQWSVGIDLREMRLSGTPWWTSPSQTMPETLEHEKPRKSFVQDMGVKCLCCDDMLTSERPLPRLWKD